MNCNGLLERRATTKSEKTAPSLRVAAKIWPYFVVVLALESPKPSSSASSARFLQYLADTVEDYIAEAAPRIPDRIRPGRAHSH